MDANTWWNLLKARTNTSSTKDLREAIAKPTRKMFTKLRAAMFVQLV